jgi:nucleoside-triphosphatase THEP1
MHLNILREGASTICHHLGDSTGHRNFVLSERNYTKQPETNKSCSETHLDEIGHVEYIMKEIFKTVRFILSCSKYSVFLDKVNQAIWYFLF